MNHKFQGMMSREKAEVSRTNQVLIIGYENRCNCFININIDIINKILSFMFRWRRPRKISVTDGTQQNSSLTQITNVN